MTGVVAGHTNDVVSSSQFLPLSNSMEVLTAIAQQNLDGGGGAASSNVVISPFGELIVALIQLQMQNTQYFKETAAQAAARLQAAAQQEENTESKQFLSNFSNALQTAAQTGELPELPTPPVSPIQAYSRTGQPVATNPLNNPISASTNISLTQLFASLTSQVNAAQKS